MLGASWMWADRLPPPPPASLLCRGSPGHRPGAASRREPSGAARLRAATPGLAFPWERPPFLHRPARTLHTLAAESQAARRGATV